MKNLIAQFKKHWPPYAAALAVLAAPLLLLLQSSGGGPGSEPLDLNASEQEQRTLAEASALAWSGDVGQLAMVASYYIRMGRNTEAEAYMKHGTYQLRSPAIKLFYGDFLMNRGGKHDLMLAGKLFSEAQKAGEAADASDFVRAAKERLAALQKLKVNSQ